MADRSRGTISRIKTNPACGLIGVFSFPCELMGRTRDVARPVGGQSVFWFTDRAALGRPWFYGLFGAARESGHAAPAETSGPPAGDGISIPTRITGVLWKEPGLSR